MNVGTLWRSAYLFGASFIFTIGKRYPTQASDTPKTERHVPYYEYENWKAFEKTLPRKSNLVFIEQAERSHVLSEAVHPEQAIYILGAEDKGIPEKLMRGCQIMEIPYEKNISMNVSVAGSIVMYDRFIKGAKK